MAADLIMARARLRLGATAAAVTGIGPRRVRTQVRWARAATLRTAAATAVDRPRVRNWICGSRSRARPPVVTADTRAGPIRHTVATAALAVLRATADPVLATPAMADRAAELQATADRVVHRAMAVAARLAVAAGTIQRRVVDTTPEADILPAAGDTPAAEDTRVVAAIPVAEDMAGVIVKSNR
jgi:hypothetical protein